VLPAFLSAIRVFFRSVDSPLEVLARRQQVAALKRTRPRPALNRLDRFFSTTLRHRWPRGEYSGHCEARDGDRIAAGWFSPVQAIGRFEPHSPNGRLRTRTGPPKIHAELLELGFEVSERRVARYLQRLRRRSNAAKRWLF
jgi:hypothetical protein